MNNADRYLLERVRQLEDRVRQLNLSRRVLMRLLMSANMEKQAMQQRLEAENKRLQRRKNVMAERLLERNRYIVELEAQHVADKFDIT